MTNKYAEVAISRFLAGYNCAQAVTSAFAERFGLESEAVLAMTAGLGAGLGGLRETCGAVSAMALLAGMSVGSYAPSDIATKKRLYSLVRKMAREFMDQHETISCRELLRKASCAAAPHPSHRSAEYYSARPCAQFVATAAEIVARNLDCETVPADTD